MQKRISSCPRILLIPVLIVLGFAPARADLFVTQDYSRAPSTIMRFDHTTGAFRNHVHELNEGWDGLATRPGSNELYATTNVLGSAYVYVFDASGNYLRTLGEGVYDVPGEHVFGPDGSLYAIGALDPFWNSDARHGVIKFDPTTGIRISNFIDSGPDFSMRLTSPAFGPDGNFYAVNRNGVVRYHGGTGAYLGVFVPLGRGGLEKPSAMIFGNDGQLYVGDSATHSVLKFDAAGTFKGVFIVSGTGGLSQPEDFAFGAGGDLLIASLGSGKILRYDWPTGAFSGALVSDAAVNSPLHIAVTTPPPASQEVVWLDDALPPGAQPGATGGDGWNWVTSSPTPMSGSKAHKSNHAPGLHEHFFNFANPFPVAAGESLFAYIYLDEANPPFEVMLSWKDDLNWEHRAYWGANLINAGKDGTASRRYMGGLPKHSGGGWVRLEVPASLVGLEGKNLRGMSFSLYGGIATWDRAGKSTPGSPPPPPPPPPPQGDFTVWYDDGFPAGAKDGFRGSAPWTWTNASTPAPGASPRALHSTSDAGLHEHYFNFASPTFTLAAGEKFSVMVYVDPANPPRQIAISFCANKSWEHRAYWGDAIMRYAAEDSAGQKCMGDIPAGGGWVQLEIPAEAVNLVGQPIAGMSMTLYNGRAIFDRFGKLSP